MLWRTRRPLDCRLGDIIICFDAEILPQIQRHSLFFFSYATDFIGTLFCDKSESPP